MAAPGQLCRWRELEAYREPTQRPKSLPGLRWVRTGPGPWWASSLPHPLPAKPSGWKEGSMSLPGECRNLVRLSPPQAARGQRAGAPGTFPGSLRSSADTYRPAILAGGQAFWGAQSPPPSACQAGSEEGRAGRTTKGLNPALAGAGHRGPGCRQRCGSAFPPLLQKGLEGSRTAESPPQSPGAGSRPCAGLSAQHPGLASPGPLGCPLEAPLPCWSQPRSSAPSSGCPPHPTSRWAPRPCLRTQAGEHDFSAGQGAQRTCWDMTEPGWAGLGRAGSHVGTEGYF